MIIALSGRRIDDPKAVVSQFPLSQRWIVRHRLQTFFQKNKVRALICSGACGADLLALEVAGNLGIRRTMILPSDKAAFKLSSVTDRPGNWERIFDKVYADLDSTNDVIILNDAGAIPLEKVNAAILQEAIRQKAATAAPPTEDVVGLLVWDGASKDSADYTLQFRDTARKTGIKTEEISTIETPQEKALLILNQGARGQLVEDVMNLYGELQIVSAFNYARRILGLVRKEDDLTSTQRLKLDQKYALAIYKDVDLPVELRLEEALKVLRQICSTDDARSQQETLGLTGAVYKRKWEADGQKIQLEYALDYYMKGYQLGPATDSGYTGINAAYVLDLLAQNELDGKYKSQADAIRTRLIELLEKKTEGLAPSIDNYWIYVTIAEAYFGLSRYEDARPWLQKAIALGSIPDWQLESTARQLARISLLQQNDQVDNIQGSGAWNVLKELIGNVEEDIGALRAAFLGKVGLALSGGGFRAALYHIGVLARLAELDMLRNIEVLSCVSGGSIIGAHYYLELKHLLETKVDREITRDDYVGIVKRISREFLAGVQKNLRTRVVSNWWANTRMFWDRDYSRSLRLGTLYEREIFSRVEGYNRKDPIWLNHLFIHPLQDDGFPHTSFNPKYDNWRRKAKIPILLLNATALNTGHNWQFSASWMGESPFTVQKIDANDRLRRMYYKESGEKAFRRVIRLGHAVAASSAVPGLFDPLKLNDLYPGYKVSLVDGGVHDNQGISGLLEQDCTVMLVSDASGQMGSLTAPSNNPLAVPLRANDILMERVRNAEYQDMAGRMRTGLLKGFMFIHLKMELDIHTVNWVHCEDPREKEDLNDPDIIITTYNIRKDIQQLLSVIRTDLDSFCDTEAHALMTSGYLMTKREYPQSIKGFTTGTVQEENWRFLEIRDDLKDPDAPDKMLRLLKVAGDSVFKIWQLKSWLRVVSWLLLMMAAGSILWCLILWWGASLELKVSTLGISVVVLVAGMFINKWLIRIIRYRDTIIRLLIILGLISVLWVAANIHLYLFDGWYLKTGRRE